ncbi:hypothetical protein ACHAWT_000843 [Skeletonema menzelii]
MFKFKQRHNNNIAARAHVIEEEMMFVNNEAESANPNPATYKLFMADTSQVYCGRSLPNHNDAVGDKIGLSSLLATAASYRPTRARRPNIIAREADDDDERAEAFHRRSSAGSDSSMSTDGSSCRRSSGTTSTPADSLKQKSTSGGSGGGGATLRRKCQPLHKCATVNQSVSSIMRPSRYSMNSSTHSLSSELNDSSVHSSNQPRRVSRRATCEGLPAQSMHSYFLPESSHRSLSFTSSLDDQWVASGVDFSSSVEVYVFRK